MWFAAKRLSAVEASANASHQHEFNAGRLRLLLGFSTQSMSGSLRIIYHPVDGTSPETETCSYTIYNSRAGKPRSPEYRLYFDSRTLQSRTKPGDILVLVRQPGDEIMRALVIPSASAFGVAVGATLDAGGMKFAAGFRRLAGEIARASVDMLFSEVHFSEIVDNPDDFLAVTSEGFIDSALRAGRLPSTRDMADEAARIVGRLCHDRSNPDLELQWSLDAETALFQHIEQQLGQLWLDQRSLGGTLRIEDAMDFALRRLQARRSRRGQSLQHHFARLLDTRLIRYTPQCPTERGETPDFIFPGRAEYADPSFPANRLRMVACKSVLKERWGQPLKEAARIPEKYLLTVDQSLTTDALHRMLGARLVLFLPRPTISQAYGTAPFVGLLKDVADLLTRLT